MSFQSHAFLLIFLPLVLAGVAGLRRAAPGLLKPFLITASFGFYASWQPACLPIFLASIAGNRLAAEALHLTEAPPVRPPFRAH